MRRFGVYSVVLVALNACIPYSFTGGGLPSHIRTVAIVPFENQTATPELPRDYKIVVEVAGRGGLSPLTIDARPLDSTSPIRNISRTDSGVDAPRRAQLDLSGLAPTPHQLRLIVPMKDSSAMVLPLGKPIDPVEKSTQKSRWDIVLVPVLPLLTCH